MKKILVIGAGAREHALGWKLKQSSEVEKIYFVPGNAGTAQIGENISLPISDREQLVEWCKKMLIDFTVVGPEAPLADGIVDAFKSAGLAIFGPTKLAARLETSKTWAAEFMQKHNIPQPEFNKCTSVADAYTVLRHVDWQKKPVVIKVDGLAAGKGVFLPASHEESLQIINSIMLSKAFGDAGN